MMRRVLLLTLAMVVWFCAAAVAAPDVEWEISTVESEPGDSCTYSTITVTGTFADTCVTVVNVCNWGWQSNSYYQLPAASFLDQATWAERQPKDPGPKPVVIGPLADFIALAAQGRPASGGPGTLSHTLTLMILGTIIVLISGFLIVEKYYLRSRHDEGCVRD